jgi:MFS family permease
VAARDFLSAFEVRDFRWLWSGTLGSQFAMNMEIVARGWIVYALTGSALGLASVTLSFMLPQALFSLWGGVLADRLPKRRIIATAQSCNCAVTALMAINILSGHVQTWHFLVTGFVNGTILALSMPSRQSFIPELIPERLILTGMALNTTSWNLSRGLGPALAGMLIAMLAGGDRTSFLGVGVVYCCIAALYGIAAATTLRVHHPGQVRARDGASPLADVLEGLRYVRSNRPILALLLLSIVPFIFGMPLNTLLPAFNADVLAGGPEGLGLLVSCMGIGAILGSLSIGSLGELPNKGRWLIASAAGWGATLIAFGAAADVPIAAVAVGSVGLVSAWNTTLNRGLLQTQVDSRMRGRIMSIDMMSHGLMPLGVLPISFIADHYGLGIAVQAAGVAFVIVIAGLACFMPAVRQLERALAAPG